MNNDIAVRIDEIAKLPPDWHGAGSLSSDALRAIARHAEKIGVIKSTVETGAGKTTLLFSHLSSHHTVFALTLTHIFLGQLRSSYSSQTRQLPGAEQEDGNAG